MHNSFLLSLPSSGFLKKSSMPSPPAGRLCCLSGIPFLHLHPIAHIPICSSSRRSSLG